MQMHIQQQPDENISVRLKTLKRVATYKVLKIQKRQNVQNN